jgi:hypothetical protein
MIFCLEICESVYEKFNLGAKNCKHSKVRRARFLSFREKPKYLQM